jgi:hypothetical protein
MNFHVQPFLKCTTLVVQIFAKKINLRIQPMVYLQTLQQMLYWRNKPGLKTQGRNCKYVFEKWFAVRGICSSRAEACSSDQEMMRGLHWD